MSPEGMSRVVFRCDYITASAFRTCRKRMNDTRKTDTQHTDVEIGKVKIQARYVAITTMLVVPLHHVWLMVEAANWVSALTGVLDVYNRHCDQ
jgi:hypothetical protein